MNRETEHSCEREAVLRLSELHKTVTFAESCTGGLLAKRITDVPGASAVFPGSIVSYSNEIKMKCLDVSQKTIEKETEVSLSCATEMAKGARKAMGTDYALSTTGYAGPTGGTDENPTGTVYIGYADETGAVAKKFFFTGTREEVRNQASDTAFRMLLQLMNG